MCITETWAQHRLTAVLTWQHPMRLFPCSSLCYVCHAAYLSQMVSTRKPHKIPSGPELSPTITICQVQTRAVSSRIAFSRSCRAGSAIASKKPSNPNLTHWLICTKHITADGLLKIHKSILVHWQVSHTPGQSEGIVLIDRFTASKDRNHSNISREWKWKFWVFKRDGATNLCRLPAGGRRPKHICACAGVFWLLNIMTSSLFRLSDELMFTVLWQHHRLKIHKKGAIVGVESPIKIPTCQADSVWVVTMCFFPDPS